MHRAFVAGASLAEVVAAAGVDEAEAYDRWSKWAEGQAELVIGERVSVDADEVAAIRDRLPPPEAVAYWNGCGSSRSLEPQPHASARVLRRVRVVAVAVLLPDLAVAAVQEELRLVTTCR